MKDELLVRLDEIAREVKQSEEWEEVRMSILSSGIDIGRREGERKGEKRGREKGAQALIRVCRKYRITREATLENLKEELALTEKEAIKYLNRYLKTE